MNIQPHTEWLDQMNTDIPDTHNQQHAITNRLREVHSHNATTREIRANINAHLIEANNIPNFATWRTAALETLERADQFLSQHTIRDVTQRAASASMPASVPIPAPAPAAAAGAESKEEEAHHSDRDSGSSKDSLEGAFLSSGNDIRFSSSAAIRPPQIPRYRYAEVENDSDSSRGSFEPHPENPEDNDTVLVGSLTPSPFAGGGPALSNLSLDSQESNIIQPTQAITPPNFIPEHQAAIPVMAPVMAGIHTPSPTSVVERKSASPEHEH